jgi:hypothetical protein
MLINLIKVIIFVRICERDILLRFTSIVFSKETGDIGRALQDPSSTFLGLGSGSNAENMV